jgi:heterodisulfide reductase subunit B
MTLPARNISLTREFDDSFFFQSVCECTDPDHGHSLIVELDEDGHDMTVSIYQQLEWAQYSRHDEPNVLVRFFIRLRDAIKYVVAGSVKVEGHHLFHEHAARDYANAILHAADELNKRRTVRPVSKTTGQD